ncbi:hypothetical protein [Geminocystis sp.]|uniref:hypothetical protein n=1 Tax=Geminocystis sp. TaxID=2664100 RepID=UPI00359486CC
MSSTQVSFRLDTDVYNNFSAKIKELGISKQSFYERAITLLISGSFPFDSEGSNKVVIDSKEIEQIVKDNLQDLAELVVNNSDFMMFVAEVVKDRVASTLVLQGKVTDNLKDIKDIDNVNLKVNNLFDDSIDPLPLVNDNDYPFKFVDPLLPSESQDKGIIDIQGITPLNDDAVVSDELTIDKMRLNCAKLPFNPSQKQIENALGIPETYLSKHKNNPEKLTRWQFYLNMFVKKDGVYYNKFLCDDITPYITDKPLS